MDNIDKDKLYQAYKQLLEEENAKALRTVAESIKEIETVTGKTIAEIPGIISSAFIAAMNAIEMIDLKSCRKNEERFDAPWEYFEAVFPHVPPHIADMLRIQLLTSLRPSEVCNMTLGRIRKERKT